MPTKYLIPNHDRTERPVVTENTSCSSAQESIHVFLVTARMERIFVVGQPTGLFSTFNEVDIDFRIFGLPHSVVKQAENSRALVKKIENHFHRRDLQADLQQNNAHTTH